MVRKKHILVAVNGSVSSRRAVEYVASLLADSQGMRITLANFSRIPKQGNKLRNFLRVIKDLCYAAKTLYDYGKILVKSGFPWRDVAIKPIPVDKDSIAECIIDEQRSSGCCTVVVGRRQYLSRKEEFLFGSTSNELRRIANECAIWIVG